MIAVSQEELVVRCGPSKKDLLEMCEHGHPLYVRRVSKESKIILKGQKPLGISVTPILEEKTAIKYQLFLTKTLIEQLEVDSFGYLILPLPSAQEVIRDMFGRRIGTRDIECRMVFDLRGFYSEHWAIFVEL